MTKRPLFLFWTGLMLVILLCRAAGLPIFGEPVLPPEEREALEAGFTGQVTGTVRFREIREKSIRYILGDVDIRHGDRNLHFSEILFSASKQAVFTFSYQGSLRESDISSESEYGTAGQDGLLPAGSKVRFSARCSFTDRAGNPGQFDSRHYYACRKIWVQAYAGQSLKAEILKPGQAAGERLCRSREYLLERLRQCVSSKSAGVLGAMLLGSRGMMDEETRAELQSVSLYHIISISGMHIMILGMALYRLIMYLLLFAGGASAGRQKKIRMSAAAALVSAAAMTGFCLWIGSPVPAVRAVIMFAVSLGARTARRSYDTISALSLAGILLLTGNPGYLFDAGFQLSAAAVMSTAVLYPELMRLPPDSFWEKGSRRKQILEGVLRAAAVWASVTAGMLPLTAWYFYEIPVLGLPANLAAVPFLGVIMIWGFLGLAASAVSAAAGGFVLYPLDLGIRMLTGTAGCIGGLPGSVWICGKPSLGQVVLYYLLLAAFRTALGAADRRKAKGRNAGGMKAAALSVLIMSFPVLFFRIPDKCSVTMLDVGQGDGLVLAFSNGLPFEKETVFLCDGGSSDIRNAGRYRILPYLEYRGIREVEAAFVSHADEDHINGLEEILIMMAERQSPVRIRRLLMPEWMKRDRAADGLRRAAVQAGVSLIYLRSGDRIRIPLSRDGSESAVIQILHPTASGGAQEGNAGSLVFHLTCGDFRALFTGDLEGEGEKEIQPFLSDIDCLKVAHHGSEYSTSEAFLRKTAPEAALISCGKNNRYGHPHRELLRRLSGCGADIYRTDQCGAVTVTADPDRGCFYLKTFLESSY